MAVQLCEYTLKNTKNINVMRELYLNKIVIRITFIFV